MVWSVKYKRKILIGEIEASLKKVLYEISKEKGFVLKESEIMADHVHVFISAKPKISPGYIYKMLKGISSRKLFLQHPILKSNLWDGHLWNSSTYVETIGHISEAVVRKYIEEQKTK